MRAAICRHDFRLRPPAYRGARRSALPLGDARTVRQNFLQSVNGPADVRALSRADLPQLAQEVRAVLIDHAARKSGHFGASMGVVELTIALHAVFESPHDKIVWDTGHQAYAHKLLTGRRERFDTIREDGGLTPFCKRDESEHDIFGAGHASTSISAAVGVARALRLKNNPHKVIAVIGDGSMSGGVALEGLNNLGHSGLNMLVVYNENGMSIDPNVGALHHEGPESKSRFFRSLGMRYVGPIDGHNLPKLLETLDGLRERREPCVLHIRTVKGKGYGPAEAQQLRFHAPPKFDPLTGVAQLTMAPKAPAYTEVFADALIRLAEQDPRIVAFTAGMPTGTGLVNFQQRFYDRFFDVGIAEQAAALQAAGMATEGFVPVVGIYSTFLQRAFDHLLHDFATQHLPGVFAMDRAGLVGQDGPTHHGVFDIAYWRMVPEAVMLAPRDENMLGHMLKTAVECGKLAALRYPRGNGVGIPIDDEMRALQIGTAELLRNSDHPDVALIPVGSMVHPTLAVAERLAAIGVRSSVLDPRFLKPLDDAMILDVARRAKRVITIEEGTRVGGFGSAVAELLFDRDVSGVELRRLALPDGFVTHGSPDALMQSVGLDGAGLERSIRQFVRR